MNQNPTMEKASENMTFILTGKFPKDTMQKYKEQQAKLLKEIFEDE